MRRTYCVLACHAVTPSRQQDLPTHIHAGKQMQGNPRTDSQTKTSPAARPRYYPLGGVENRMGHVSFYDVAKVVAALLAAPEKHTDGTGA